MQVAPIIEALLFGLGQKTVTHEYLVSVAGTESVIPAKAGIQLLRSEPSFRRGDIADFGFLLILQESRRTAAITFNFSITISDRLTWPFVVLALCYRRLRCGYAFRRIPLTQGQYAIVDSEDFERLNKHKWHANKARTTYYAVRRIHVGTGKWKHVKMHRDILNPPDKLYVDHINHNGLDNRRANLRTATHRQNCYNRVHFTKNPSSKYKGVSFNKRKEKWDVQIRYNGKSKFLGYFDDEVEAAKAYDKAAKEHQGEFAALNFPDSPRRTLRTTKKK